MIRSGPSCESTKDIAATLVRLRDGDHDAWRALSNMFRQRLRELAESKLPAEILSRVDASDVVQQTLAEANESIAAFHGRSLSELFAWLAAILSHSLGGGDRRNRIT